jgi:hypothetical protein
VTDLRKAIDEELAVCRDMVRDGTEVAPRFTVFAPGGPYFLMVELPDDKEGRRKHFDVVKLFMIWKAASGFTLATEISDPDAISVIAVTRSDVIGAVQRITRSPLTFSKPQWLNRGEFAEEIVSLLPPKVLSVTMLDMAAMREAFEEGSMPGITWVKE